jgi:hypothetical protein
MAQNDVSHEAFLVVNNITPRSLEREKEREGLYLYWFVFCVSILLPLKWSVIPSLLTSEDIFKLWFGCSKLFMKECQVQFARVLHVGFL